MTIVLYLNMSSDEDISQDISPSKILVDNLRDFHISSPLDSMSSTNITEEVVISEDNCLSVQSKNLKQYLPNNEFSDSKFITHIDGDSQISGFDDNVQNDNAHDNAHDNDFESDNSIIRNKGYLKKLEDWSLDEGGTVQRKVGSVDNSKKENYEPPQWKQHLFFNGKMISNQNENHNKKNNVYKDPASDLIVSTSFSDLSGIPTNTFKKHSSTKSHLMDNINSNTSTDFQKSERYDNNNKILKYELLEKEMEEDITEDFVDDPAGFANNVFDNMMKKQRSMHQLPSIAKENYNNVGNSEDDGYSTDPALAAHRVFDGVMINESVFHGGLNDKISAPRRNISNTNNNRRKSKVSLEEYESESSYLGDTPSTLSPIINKFNEKRKFPTNDKNTSTINNNNNNNERSSNINNINTNNDSNNYQKNLKSNYAIKSPVPLIKPEAFGLVFNQETGVWEAPQKNLQQDISSSRTVDNITSTNNSDLIEGEEENESIRLQPTDRRGLGVKHLANYTDMDMIHNQTSVTNIEDTPIGKPVINPKFLLPKSDRILISKEEEEDNFYYRRKGNQRFNRNVDLEMIQNGTTIGNITGISQVFETSFHQTKRDLVSVITNVISTNNESKNKKWKNIEKIELNDHQLESIFGIGKLLPNLIECDLSFNMLNSVEGLSENIISLNLSHNNISNKFLSLELFQDLEEIDLSFNEISYNLKHFYYNRHLRSINLSNNFIKSLENLGYSRIINLNLSNNKITNEVNFSKLIKNDHKLSIDKDCVNSSWKSIEQLDLSGNKISIIKNLHVLSKLRVLILDNNPIETVNCGIDEENNDLNKNSVMMNLRYLSILNVKPLKFDINNGKFFNSFAEMRVLKIDAIIMKKLVENSNKKLPLSLEKVEVINYNKIAITKINELFNFLPNGLKTLNIINFGPELTKLPKNFELILPILQDLNLKGNSIKSLYELVKSLPNLSIRRLSISNNPIVKDCNNKELNELKQNLKLTCPNLIDITT